MISPKGMDELFWDKEFEDVHDRVERVEMAAEIKEINEKNYSRLVNSI
jgi:hypothetical protein